MCAARDGVPLGTIVVRPASRTPGPPSPGGSFFCATFFNVPQPPAAGCIPAVAGVSIVAVEFARTASRAAWRNCIR
jgi:hypothetical protein